MRKLIIACFTAVVLMGGCAGNSLLVHDPVKVVTVQQKIDAAIDQSNAGIAAAARQLKTMYKNNVIEHDQAQKYYDFLMEAASNTDAASDLLSVGNLSEAEAQLALAKALTAQVVAYLVQVKGAK